MEQRWQINDGHDVSQVEQFSQGLNSPPVMAKLLLNRGIDDVESARRYFIPELADLHDPFLMADMEKAVVRIATALSNKEKILVYGDYDVDGTTATAMLVRFFRALDHPVDFYIPARLEEGYGVSSLGINKAHEQNCSLIITVDCGVTAIDEIALANSYGIDVIVCDHHRPGSSLPPALAILNPKRLDCSYPFEELAGVGVAFKLLQGLQQHLGLAPTTVFALLYFVAMGSAADIVPLVDENRIFVKHGLRVLSQLQQNPGLHALKEITNLVGRELGTGHVVFVMAPRINAVGRMGDAGRAVRLMTTEREGQARNIATILERENMQRRKIDEDTLSEALALIEKEYNPETDSVFVLNSEKWHPGVIGIVASRIVEKYFRPTIMISTENGEGRGSARSIPGFDIHAALKQCEDLMINFGGHKYAAGLSVETNNIALLRERLSEVASGLLTEEMLTPKLMIDSELDFKDITPDFLKLMHKMAPFGPQNTRPTFCSNNLQVVGSPTIVGKNHLKLKVRQDGIVMDAIGFNLGEKIYRVPSGDKNVEMAFVVDENEYRGRSTIQLRVKDLR